MRKLGTVSTWRAYAIALGLALVTAVVVRRLAPSMGALSASLFALPIALSVWLGGLGPGALAMLLSVGAAALLVFPPISAASLVEPGVRSLVVFAVIMALLTAILARLREAERLARERAQRAEVLARTSLALARAHDQADLARMGERELAAALQQPFLLQALSDDGTTLHTAAVHHPAPTVLETLRDLRDAPQRVEEAVTGSVLKTGQPLQLPGLNQEQLHAGFPPRFWPILDQLTGHTLFAVPLRLQDRAGGLLTVWLSPKAGPLNADEQAFVQSLADCVAAAWHQARRWEAEQQQRQAAEHAAEVARRSHGLAQALAGARSLEAVAAMLAADALPLLGADGGSLAVLAAGQSALEVRPLVDSGSGPAGTALTALDAPLPLAEAARTARPLWLSSPEAVRARFPAALAEEHVGWNGGLAAIPLLQKSHVVGSLVLKLKQPGEIDPAQRQSILSVGQQAALAVSRLAALAVETAGRLTAEKAAADHALLLEAASAFGLALSTRQAIDAILEHALPLAGAEIAAVSLVDAGGSSLEIAGSVGYPEEALAGLRRLRVDQVAAEPAALAGQEALWLPSHEAVAAAYPDFAPSYASLRCQALAVLPLLAADRALGTLTLGFAEARAVSPPEQEMLLSFSRASAQALVRARAIEAEQTARAAADQAQAHAEYLAQVNAALAGSLSLPVTLQTIARLALRQVADFCLVYALGSDGVPHGAAHAHRDSQLEQPLGEVSRLLQALPGQRAVVAELLRSGRPLRIPELSQSMLSAFPAGSGLPSLVGDLAPRSMMVVPMVIEGRTVGMLVLCTSRAGRLYGPEAEAQALELAAPAAQAVDNALQHALAQSLNMALEESVNERTEELQATIAKLEAENDERERAQAQLELSREQLRGLSARLQAAREEERARIAKEVHDELGQQLASLKMDIGWLRKKLREQQEPLLRKSKSMAELIDVTVETVRKITQELRPAILDDFGLLAAIEWQLQEFQKRYGIECQLLKDGDEIRLDPESATAVFRVFQETLSNVARHANATRVEVAVEQHDHHLLLQVEDNGRGISDRELFGPDSLGLLGMRERIHLLAGEIDIRGLPSEGTVVRVKVPLPAPDGSHKDAGPSDGNGAAAAPGNNGANLSTAAPAAEHSI